MQKITPFLWFDTQAEEAVAFYLSVFKDGKIHTTTRYPENGPRPAGTVMTIAFELQGQQFVALNGGPGFPFTNAVSLVVNLRVAGGNRSLPGEAGGGWGRADPVRVAEGQVRHAVADHAEQDLGLAARR